MSILALDSSPKITVIYDNRKYDRSSLQPGFGFSCLIEWTQRKVLFDTGGSRNAFFHNIKQLKIELGTITHVVFSHKHWDHTAAMDEMLGQIKDGVTVYLPNPFPESLLRKIPNHLKIVMHDDNDFSLIDANIYSLVLTGGYWCTKIQEQSLVLDTPKGLVILTGCAHPGIVKILTETQKRIDKKIHMVIGGFHLHHSWSCTSAKVVRQFRNLMVEKVVPCHCAGAKAIQQFQEAYGEDFIQAGTGTCFDI